MTTHFGLEGPRVRLVPSERSLHLENALRWFNDPRVTAKLAQNAGLTRRMAAGFFDRVEADRDADFHWAILDESRTHVGFIALHDVNWRLRSATGGLMIGEPDAWGRGYATEVVRLRTRFAFDEMGLHRIEGHTIHPGMARVFEKCGYVREGTARAKIWRGGRWHDAALYAILDSDPILDTPAPENP